MTRRRLLAAGISEREIDRRLDKGTLIRVHRGVYRVGHVAPSMEATYLAAVWACGEGAVLSGRAAAHLLGLIKGPSPAPEVSAPTARNVKGVRTRHRGRLPRTTWKGIPVTTPAQTLVDLAATQEDLARACHEAGIKHRTTPRHVAALLERRPRSPGAAKLRSIRTYDDVFERGPATVAEVATAL